MLQMSMAQQGNRLAPNLTDRDLSSHLGPVAGSGGLYVQFYYDRVRIQSVDPERNGKYEARLCIAKVPKGDRLTIAHGYITEEDAAREFPREYAAFKQYEAVPTSGTPLHELPGISQSQIAYLTIYNVRSIEDLATLPQEQVSQMGLEAAQAYNVARHWINAKTDAKPMLDAAQSETVMAARMKSLEDQLAAKTRENIELNAKVSILNQIGVQPAAPQAAAMTLPQGDAVPYQMMNGFPVPEQAADGDDASGQSEMFEGGMVDGNDDLGDAAPTAEDPLGIGSSRKRRG